MAENVQQCVKLCFTFITSFSTLIPLCYEGGKESMGYWVAKMTKKPHRLKGFKKRFLKYHRITEKIFKSIHHSVRVSQIDLGGIYPLNRNVIRDVPI